MPSFQTLFRAVVMVAVVVAGVKGWKAYGPTNEQVQRAYNQLRDVVQAALPSNEPTNSTAAADPRHAPAAVVASPPLAPRPGGTQSQLLPPAAPMSAPADAPKLLSSSEPASAGVASSPFSSPGASFTKDSIGQNSNDVRVAELVAKLQRMGAENTSLAPWGGGGLYRFSCSAPLANAPMMTQHFESVAAEPAAAVEQVVAKVEAWQVAQRDGGILRY